MASILEQMTVRIMGDASDYLEALGASDKGTDAAAKSIAASMAAASREFIKAASEVELLSKREAQWKKEQEENTGAIDRLADSMSDAGTIVKSVGSGMAGNFEEMSESVDGTVVAVTAGVVAIGALTAVCPPAGIAVAAVAGAVYLASEAFEYGTQAIEAQIKVYKDFMGLSDLEKQEARTQRIQEQTYAIKQFEKELQTVTNTLDNMKEEDVLSGIDPSQRDAARRRMGFERQLEDIMAMPGGEAVAETMRGEFETAELSIQNNKNKEETLQALSSAQEQAYKTGTQWILSLEEEAEVFGKTAGEAAKYKALQQGVSEQHAEMIGGLVDLNMQMKQQEEINQQLQAAEEAKFKSGQQFLQQLIQENEQMNLKGAALVTAKAEAAGYTGATLEMIKAEAELNEQLEKEKKDREELEQKTKSQQESIKDAIKNLEIEAATFDMTAGEAAAYKASMEGATQAQQEQIRVLTDHADAMRKGKELTKELFPIEEYKDRVDELKRLFDEIGPSFEDTFKEGIKQAEEDLDKALLAKEVKFEFNNDAVKKGSKEFNDLLAQVANRQLAPRSIEQIRKNAGLKEGTDTDKGKGGKDPSLEWVDIKSNTGSMDATLKSIDAKLDATVVFSAAGLA